MGRAMRPIDNPKDLKTLKYWFKCRSERDNMLFQIMLHTGYRIGDLIGLLVGDVREAIERGTFIITEEKILNMKKSNCIKKGIKFQEKDVIPREVPIAKSFALELKRYIKDRPDNEYMFPSRKKHYHISSDRFGKILNQAGRECNIKFPVSNHTIRKTFAYNIHNITGDIEKTKAMLAHSSIEATKLYLGIDRIMFKNTMEELAEIFGK